MALEGGVWITTSLSRFFRYAVPWDESESSPGLVDEEQSDSSCFWYAKNLDLLS